MRSWRWTAGPSTFAALGVLLTTTALVTIGAPSSVLAKTELEVTTAAGGRYQPGATTPFIVSVSADRAVEGTLTIRMDGSPVASERVEVSGGSTDDVIIVVATVPWQAGYSAEFDADGDEDDSDLRITATAPGGDELIGVLPTLAQRNLPEQGALTVDLGVARFYPLDPALLDLGPDGLGTFSQVLATADDLAALTDQQRNALSSWVSDEGGTLILDESPEVAIPFTPTAPLSVDQASFGLGRIQFTRGAAAGGDFDDLVRPSASRSGEDFPWLQIGSIPTSIQLARDAGVQVPAISSLILALLAYTVFVGPVLWLLLKRRRREPLLWAAIPLTALIVSLGVYVVGRQLRSSTTASHATVIADLPNGREVASQVLVTSPNGGSAGIRLPDGWRVAPSSQQAMFGGPFGQARAVDSAPVERDGRLTVDLDPGGINVMSVEGTVPATGTPAFEIAVTADGSDLVGSVTNTTDKRLTNVLVSSGQAVSRIAALDPGEVKELTLRNPNTLRIQGDALMEQLNSGDPWTPNDTDANPGAVLDYLARSPRLRGAGFVTAIGWTRAADPMIETLSGVPITNGRTAFLTTVLVSPSDGATPNPVEFLRGYASSVRPTDRLPVQACTDIPLTWSMGLPDDGETGDALVLDINTRSVAALDVWDGDEWLPAGMSEVAVGALSRIVAVPATARADGTLYLRATFSCDAWGFADPMPTLRPPSPEDEAVVLGDELAASEAES